MGVDGGVGMGLGVDGGEVGLDDGGCDGDEVVGCAEDNERAADPADPG